MPNNILSDIPVSRVETAIYGCGNLLFGDDGVGPEVINRLKECELPDDVLVEDVGTSIRDILFDYLLAPQIAPRRIIIIDAVDYPDRKPGEVFEITPRQVPAAKIHDFSLHQFPTVNMLAELSEATDIEIRVFAVQIQHIPDEVSPGLSVPVSQAVTQVCDMILEILNHASTTNHPISIDQQGVKDDDHQCTTTEER